MARVYILIDINITEYRYSTQYIYRYRKCKIYIVTKTMRASTGRGYIDIDIRIQRYIYSTQKIIDIKM